MRRSALGEVGGAVDRFTGMFEDQVLLAKLYLNHCCVMSGAETACYRRHADSTSARAERAGTYHHDAPSSSHRAYLQWLIARPQLEGRDPGPGGLRAAISARLNDYDNAPGPSRTPADRLKAVNHDPSAGCWGSRAGCGSGWSSGGSRSAGCAAPPAQPPVRLRPGAAGRPHYVEEFLAETPT